MKRRVGIAGATLGALALAGTAVVVPATASQNSTDGTRITQTGQNTTPSGTRVTDTGPAFLTRLGADQAAGLN